MKDYILEVLFGALVATGIVSIVWTYAEARRKMRSEPTAVQMRIHEGIMDHYAEQEIDPFLPWMNEIASKQFKN